jgi:subtilase family serine protease
MKVLSTFRRVLAILTIFAVTAAGQAAQAAAPGLPGPQGAGGLQFLRGHVPAAVAHVQPIGRVAATNRLNLAIGLPLRNPDALARLLQELYDPAHPNYRHYLTPEQFTAWFGPTEQDYQAVVAFAEAKGLAVRQTHPNRMLVDVTGSVAEIEKALHVTMHVYQHPKEKRTFYAPDGEPKLDLAIPVLRISGLDAL